MSGPLVQALEKRRQEDLAKTQPLTPGTLEWAWAQAQKPFKGYWDRQGLMAREGLAMADQGAQQVRQGDLSGLAGMVLGPANYLSSPINALFPIEEAQTQLPKEVSPFVAGGLELAAMMMPGPKGGKAPKPKQWSAPQVREYGNLAATPEHVRDVLEERGLKVRSEENSNAEASLSKYIFADTEQGPFKVRISDHSYLAPEYGADIRYGYPRDEIEARISIGLGLAEPWRPPDPKAHLRGEAKQWAERLGMNPNTRDAMNAIVKALETGQPTRRMREWTAANTDQALANLTEAPAALAEKIKAGWGKYDAMTTWRQDLEAMSGDDVAKVVESLGLRKSSSKKNNMTAILGASSQAARDAEIAEKIRHGR